MKGQWKPIETMPQTMQKYPVVRRYSRAIDYHSWEEIKNEKTSLGETFFTHWFDLPEPPVVVPKIEFPPSRRNC